MKSIIEVILFVSISTINAQVTQEWVSGYNGPGNLGDYAQSIAVDGSGNVYVTGWSEGSGTNYDYAKIKYNSAGVQQWVQRYNGPGNRLNQANAIAVDGSSLALSLPNSRMQESEAIPFWQRMSIMNTGSKMPEFLSIHPMKQE